MKLSGNLSYSCPTCYHDFCFKCFKETVETSKSPNFKCCQCKTLNISFAWKSTFKNKKNYHIKKGFVPF